MLRSAFPSSLSEQRPRACGGHTAARLAPFRHHAAATSIARPISTPLPSCKAAPRPRIAVGPGGGPDSGRALGRGPFAPAQASLPSPAPAKNNSSSRLTSNQRRGAAGAPLPPRSAAGEQQLPISSGVQRGKPQQASGEAAQLQTAGNDKQQCNSAAGSSASAQAVVNDVFGVNGGATGQRSASPASNADASAVAAARLLRGALEAALLPRLEAMEGRMGAMEGRIVEAVEGRITQGLMDMVQQREEKAVARERQLTAALEAMAAVMRQQGQGMGEGQQVKGQAAEPQGQRDEGQPLAVTLAAQEQRIREELKVRYGSVGWDVGRDYTCVGMGWLRALWCDGKGGVLTCGWGLGIGGGPEEAWHALTQLRGRYNHCPHCFRPSSHCRLTSGSTPFTAVHWL